MEEKKLFITFCEAFGRNAGEIYELMKEGREMELSNIMIKDIAPTIASHGEELLFEVDVRYIAELLKVFKATTLVIRQQQNTSNISIKDDDETIIH